MNPARTILRRAYDAAALVALLNMLGLIGLGVVLWRRGALDREKIQRLAGVFRDEETESDDVVDGGRTQLPDGRAKPPPVGGDALEEAQIDAEMLRLEGQRIAAELDQRLALNNAILLRVMTERERFREEQAQIEEERKQAQARRNAPGFRKQIAIFEALSPKVALEHLLAMPDSDEAARLLVAISTRKAKKIVETAKRGVKMEKMKTILQRVREVAPARSTALDAGGEGNATS